MNTEFEGIEYGITSTSDRMIVARIAPVLKSMVGGVGKKKYNGFHEFMLKYMRDYLDYVLKLLLVKKYAIRMPYPFFKLYVGAIEVDDEHDHYNPLKMGKTYQYKLKYSKHLMYPGLIWGVTVKQKYQDLLIQSQKEGKKYDETCYIPSSRGRNK